MSTNNPFESVTESINDSVAAVRSDTTQDPVNRVLDNRKTWVDTREPTEKLCWLLSAKGFIPYQPQRLP